MNLLFGMITIEYCFLILNMCFLHKKMNKMDFNLMLNVTEILHRPVKLQNQSERMFCFRIF